VALPSPRFTNNGNGTVKDNLTGLIWLKNADCWGRINWTTALINANGLANGACGLTDGSVAGDWRLPNKNELNSLIHAGYFSPALSNDAGNNKWVTGATSSFTNVQSNYYWSATTVAVDTTYAWLVDMDASYVNNANKTSTFYVWPVR